MSPKNEDSAYHIDRHSAQKARKNSHMESSSKLELEQGGHEYCIPKDSNKPNDDITKPRITRPYITAILLQRQACSGPGTSAEPPTPSSLAIHTHPCTHTC